MGAEHKLDLTSDVTHLIVGETQTPKYKYVAREREDVKCLTEGWISAVREIWMEGIDVPLQQLEDQHRLPTFHQLKICITGFEDPDQRKELEALIIKHGGEYRGDLRKDCTHLLCFSPAGAKYTSARAWGNISTVSIEWLTMSIERGLILDEQYFDPALPPEGRGRDAWKRMERGSPSLKRARTDELKMGIARKLRRTASSRFSSENFWQDIVPQGASNAESAARAQDMADYRPHTASSKTYEAQADGRGGTLHGIARRDHAAISKGPPRQGLFFGKRFLLHGFDSRRIQLLRQHLESQDAEVDSDASTFSQQSATADVNASFTIIPHSSSDEDVSSTPQLAGNKLVTELWVEKCLHSKTFIEPQSEPVHGPFRHPVSGFENLVISSTGFEGVDLMHVTKVVNLLGATYSDSLTRTTSLVLCQGDSITRPKFKHAIAWKIPAVKSSWLWECAKTGLYKSWDSFLEQPSMQNHLMQKATSPKEEQSKHLAHGKKQLLGRALPPISAASGASNSSPTEMRPTNQMEEENSLSSNTNKISAPMLHASVGYRRMEHQEAEPLREVSPNLQPPTTDNAQRSEDQSLVSSLHCLLAKTRKQASQPASESFHDPVPRKRQIFGRARSDLSMRSNISRAGSIDSMNTDGMGTPLETVPRYSPVKSKVRLATLGDDVTPLSADLLLSNDEAQSHAADDDDSQGLAMTQIGYDDSEASLWRAKLAKKLSATTEDASTTSDLNESVSRRPVLKEAAGTVSKRTRLNTK